MTLSASGMAWSRLGELNFPIMELKAVRNDLLNLNDYVDWVMRRIAWRDYEQKHGGPIPGELRSWPHRPKLPSIRRIGLIEQIAANPHPDPRLRPKRRQPSGGPRRGQS